MGGVSTFILTFVFDDVIIVLNKSIVAAELLPILVHYLGRETLLGVRVTRAEDLDGLSLLSVESRRGSDWVLLPR
jgi:hypothetical protein